MRMHDKDRLPFHLGEDRYMFVAKKPYDLIMKKTEVISMITLDNITPKLVIEYRDKKHATKGTMELFDIGPFKPKKKPSLRY